MLADAGTDSSSLGDTTRFIARVNPDVDVSDFSVLDLVVNTAKLHFFDIESGDKIGMMTDPSRHLNGDPDLA